MGQNNVVTAEANLQQFKKEQEGKVALYTKLTADYSKVLFPKPYEEFWSKKILRFELAVLTGLLSHYREFDVSLGLKFSRSLLVPRSMREFDLDLAHERFFNHLTPEGRKFSDILFPIIVSHGYPDLCAQCFLPEEDIPEEILAQREEEEHDMLGFNVDLLGEDERVAAQSCYVEGKIPRLLEPSLRRAFQTVVTVSVVRNGAEALGLATQLCQTSLLRAICLPNQPLSYLGTLISQRALPDSIILPSVNNCSPIGHPVHEDRGIYLVAPFADGSPGVHIKKTSREAKSILDPLWIVEF